ncbi:MAG: hypothetical protein KJO69_00120 [Gammaproteobacteria bacterium]|nr:hypothetical protein [Gammaproteobacteria bacterium]
MTENHSPANAEAVTNSVGSNTSVTDYALRRIGELNEAPIQPEEEVSEVAPEESQEVEEVQSEETESFEEEAEAPTEEVLSQLDLDDMSEEELRELGQKLGSKAVARFGELTAKRKAAEEQLARLQESLKDQKNPLDKPKEVKNNPFAKIDSLEGLQEKSEEVKSVVEWAEDILFNSDDYGANDVVTEVEGKELTKADVRRSLLNARKSRDEFLPAQLSVIQAKQEGVKLREAFGERAKQELPWMSGEDNDTRRQYEAMVNDPRFKQLEDNLTPDIASQLPYIIAHAANSLYGRKLVKEKPSVRIQPPQQPNGMGAKAERGESKSSKSMKQTRERFTKTGDKNDFITLRTLQMQNR